METLAPSDVEAIDRILEQAWCENRHTLFEHEVYRILSLLGLLTPTVQFIHDATEITPQILNRFSHDTLVMKIVSPAVAHKMAVNGVRTVHKDLDFLQFSCDRMQTEVAARGYPVAGVLLIDHN